MTDAELLKNLSVPTGPVDCIIDSDAYNETDDQFAISFMVKSEKCNVKAINAAPFLNELSLSPGDGMEKSYNEILKLLNLIGDERMPGLVHKGSTAYLPDEKTPVISDAAENLCTLALEYSTEHPLYVVAIGAITNVASALIMHPEIAEKIVVVWLGGHDVSWPDTKEFNMYQDVAAARVVFDSKCPLVQLPCFGVVSSFYTTGPELEFWLKGKTPIADYLYRNTVEAAEKYAKGRVWSRIVWDVTAVGWLLNDGNRFMNSILVPTPIPEYDNRYAYDNTRQLMRRVTYIKRDALFNELFRVLTK